MNELKFLSIETLNYQPAPPFLHPKVVINQTFTNKNYIYNILIQMLVQITT